MRKANLAEIKWLVANAELEKHYLLNPFGQDGYYREFSKAFKSTKRIVSQTELSDDDWIAWSNNHPIKEERLKAYSKLLVESLFEAADSIVESEFAQIQEEAASRAAKRFKAGSRPGTAGILINLEVARNFSRPASAVNRRSVLPKGLKRLPIDQLANSETKGYGEGITDLSFPVEVVIPVKQKVRRPKSAVRATSSKTTKVAEFAEACTQTVSVTTDTGVNPTYSIEELLAAIKTNDKSEVNDTLFASASGTTLPGTEISSLDGGPSMDKDLGYDEGFEEAEQAKEVSADPLSNTADEYSEAFEVDSQEEMQNPVPANPVMPDRYEDSFEVDLDAGVTSRNTSVQDTGTAAPDNFEPARSEASSPCYSDEEFEAYSDDFESDSGSEAGSVQRKDSSEYTDFEASDAGL
jgi:hypothetical protein